jgi:hypothetical protein
MGATVMRSRRHNSSLSANRSWRDVILPDFAQEASSFEQSEKNHHGAEMR